MRTVELNALHQSLLDVVGRCTDTLAHGETVAQRREIEIGVLGRDLGAVAGIGRAEREISHIE